MELKQYSHLPLHCPPSPPHIHLSCIMIIIFVVICWEIIQLLWEVSWTNTLTDYHVHSQRRLFCHEHTNKQSYRPINTLHNKGRWLIFYTGSKMPPPPLARLQITMALDIGRKSSFKAWRTIYVNKTKELTAEEQLLFLRPWHCLIHSPHFTFKQLFAFCNKFFFID